jgi:hypothetical protein
LDLWLERRRKDLMILALQFRISLWDVGAFDLLRHRTLVHSLIRGTGPQTHSRIQTCDIIYTTTPTAAPHGQKNKKTKSTIRLNHCSVKPYFCAHVL